MAELLHRILEECKATPEAAFELFQSLETISTEFMHGRWKGVDIDTGHRFNGLFEASGWYGKMYLNDEEVHPLVFFADDKKELWSVNPKMMPFRMNLPADELVGTVMRLGRFAMETKESKARLRDTEFKGRVTATMIYDEVPINDMFVKIDDNRVLGVMDFKGEPDHLENPFFFILERDDHTEYEIAPLKATHEKVVELFEMEVQNRAFALKSAQRMASKASSEEDKYFTSAWLAFEEFLQTKYAPFARKYNLSQEAGIIANIQAGLGVLGINVLPNAVMLKTMLDQTVNYNEKLKELRKIAPEEEKEFFEFVVDQEEAQIAAIRLGIEGKIKEAADLVTDFIKEHS
ncbi:MAG TPA: hypothetical protein DCE41_18085 [Cytophagales bacterium]|nr:hypothetical protein [Cytophagales bacterium]HAA18823.1 hypothetical protein [Cytophagales bacterium]HAP61940.1 hypothetical protein [Cytophagales bacterium]